ncbi:MAG: NUDIX hydrolase [Chloroflexota bacterium]|jgi:8-oxo-dGTP diphosphatase
MPYTPIVATLGYIMSPDGTQVLMVHRNARPDDLHFGKYNGLGGKLDSHEDAAAGMAREIMEEAGITIDRMTLRGTLNWPGFGKNEEDWFGFVFRIDGWSGTPFTSNPEGALEWVPVAQLQSLNLWDSDRLWIEMVFDDDYTFHGVAPYQGGKMVSWSVSKIAR